MPSKDTLLQIQETKNKLVKALAFYSRTLKAEPGEMQRAALVQAFEVCFELCWKLMKNYVEYEGGIVASPRESIRHAGAMGIVDDPASWLDFLVVRNSTVHAYDEEMIDKASVIIAEGFLAVAEKLLSYKVNG